MPDVMNLKKISGPVYEGYAPISEDRLSKRGFLEDFIKYKIAEFRTRNFFVKRIFLKYTIPVTGILILAFELVRLREPIIEKLMK